MFDSRHIQQHFSEAAGRYDAHASLQYAVRQSASVLAAKYFKSGDHILDAGCGTGSFADENKPMGWHITGADLSYGMCKIASSRVQQVVNTAAGYLPFADKAFNGVFSSLMLQWGDAQQIFPELERVLMSGGHAVIATLAEGTLCELKEAFRAIDDRPHVSEFLPAHRVIEQAETSNLSLVLAKQHCISEYYPDVVALSRSLQAIGATNKEKARSRGLMTPRRFSMLEKAYRQRFDTPRGLIASWQVLYAVLRKA